MAIFFAANFTAAANPFYGFTLDAGGPNKGTYWDLFHRSGVGPTGLDAAEIRLNGVASPTENYYGWSKLSGLLAPAQGSTVYIRVLLKLLTPIQYDAVVGGWGAKFIVLGDSGDSNTRFIWNLRDNVGTRTQAIFRIERNVEGPPTSFDTSPLPTDSWIWCQLKLVSSSTVLTADGRSFLYLNEDNANELTPTYQNPSGMTLGTYGWTDIRLGYYGKCLGIGGSCAYQMAAFEYGDTFDPNWRAGAVAPPSIVMARHSMRSR